jgi:molybdopterin synthase sulfur carrier subunit
MIVRYFAFIRDYTGTKEVYIESSSNLRELLEKLCVRYGMKFRGRIFIGDRLKDDIIILINGRHIEHLNGLETYLEEKDEISIFPRIAGG